MSDQTKSNSNDTALELLKNTAFFENPDGPAAALLKRYAYPWQILSALPAFLAANLQPAISGSVEDGAWIEDGRVQLGPGSVVERGAVVRGPAIIGRDVLIRSGAYIRGEVLIGNDCIIGNSSELLHSIVLSGARLPHYNCIMFSLVGHDTLMAAFASTSSIITEGDEVMIDMCLQGEFIQIGTGLGRFGVVIGDNTIIGGGAFFLPGTAVGRKSRIDPHAVVSGYVPYKSRVRVPAAVVDVMPEDSDSGNLP